MLLAKLGSSLLGNIVGGTGVIWASKWTIRAGQDF